MPLQGVLEIAEETFDIKDCTDDQKAFTSKFPTLKTKAVQQMNVNGTHYSHGLGYVPIYLYASYLSTKTVAIGWIGQNTPDNFSNVLVNNTEVSNDSNAEWAAAALVYLFWEKLHD